MTTIKDMWSIRWRMKKMNVEQEKKINVMLITTEDVANVLVGEVINDNTRIVRCIIDVNETKLNRDVQGIKIVGSRKDIINSVKTYNIDEILIALSSVCEEDIEQIISLCLKTDCIIKKFPCVRELINGSQNMINIKTISDKELLGREEINVDIISIEKEIEGKTILVTGAGGSIGSELCKQIAKFNPKMLLMLDIYENNVYYLGKELEESNPNLNHRTIIASIRDENRIEEIFKMFKPDIVYHAAAHKHVPLMENNPNEAIKNNIFGTLNVVRCADLYEAKRFVMISTDKAVNPTSVMGATKRVCEMIIQLFNNKSKTEYLSVRFGNVLGSNGSVIPLFRKQIESGGPVTVTDPQLERFFMTVSEAVSLVLQAGVYAKGAIYVLDMGKPIKLIDLATSLIKSYGLVPQQDIEIEIIGLQQGEKMYEEVLMEEEGIQHTENRKIFLGKPIDVDKKIFMELLEKLYEDVKNNSVCSLVTLKQLVLLNKK